MVERITDMPEGTIGFRVDGDVEREDYTELMRPALEEAMASGQPLRTLYVIEDLDDMEAGALWEDSKLGFDLGIRHHKQWERSAIVTDIEWMARDQAVRLDEPGQGARLPARRARGREALGRRVAGGPPDPLSGVTLRSGRLRLRCAWSGSARERGGATMDVGPFALAM